MLELGFERLESKPGCFVKKGVTHKDTIIVVVHVDYLLSVGKRKHLDNFFVQLEKTLKLKRVDEKRRVDYWWSVDAWRDVRGWLVSNTETNSCEQW